VIVAGSARIRGIQDRWTRISGADSRRGTVGVLCLVFLVAGLVIASLGPSLPGLAQQTGRPLADLGRLFIALFGGGLLAQFLCGPSSDRFGRRVVLVAGLACFGIGTLGVAASRSLAWVLASAVLLGLGFGGCTLAVNVLASELVPGRRASMVNLVNMFYAIGAVAGPLIAGMFLARTGTGVPAIWVGGVLLCALAPLTSVAIGRAMSAGPAAADVKRGGLGQAWVFIASCGALLLVYVGAENSIGAWAPVYLQRSAGIDPATAARATALFWLALCIGRLLAVLGGLHLSAEGLLTLSLAMAVGSTGLLWAAHGSAAISIVALAALGIAFGPVYPTALAIVTGRFPGSAGTATSRVGAIASFGGMLFPWLHGLVLTRRGTLPSAQLSLLLCGAMLAIWALMLRRAKDDGRRDV
jgi:fucose permease